MNGRSVGNFVGRFWPRARIPFGYYTTDIGAAC